MSAASLDPRRIAATAVRHQPLILHGLLIGWLLLVLIGLVVGLVLAIAPAANGEPQLLAPFRWGPAPTRHG